MAVSENSVIENLVQEMEDDKNETVLDIGLNETDENGVIKEQRLISEPLFNRLVLVPAVILILTLAYLKGRRDTGKFRFCHWPGVVWPVNLLQERYNRLPYVAAFNVTAWALVELILDDNNPFGFQVIPPLKSVVLLGSCLLFAVIFYPVFGAIASDHAIGYALGAVYIWMLTTVYIMAQYPCELCPVEKKVFEALAFLPCLLWMMLLCIYFPIRFVERVLNCRVISKHEVAKFKLTFELEHVRQLVNKIPSREELSEKPPRSLKEFIHKYIYKPIPHFRYSVSILTAVSVSMLLVWTTAMEFLSAYFELIAWGQQRIHKIFEPLENGTSSFLLSELAVLLNISDVSDYASKLELALYWWRCLEIAMYASLAGAFLWTCYCLASTLTTYRDNLMKLYRGQHLDLPKLSDWTPSNIVVRSAKYIGFQFGYALYGFSIQAIILALVFSFYTYFIVSIFVFKDYAMLLRILEYWGPILAYMIGILVIQRLLVHFCFLRSDEKDRKVLAIKQLPWFFNFQYVMIFTNCAIGLASCSSRILKAVVLGAFHIPRLDMSILPRRVERLDNGFPSYVSLLVLENTQTNPVLVIFVHLLWQSLSPSPSASAASAHLTSSGSTVQLLRSSTSTDMSLTGSSASIGTDSRSVTQSQRRKIIRNRWHLYLMLYRNPNLIRHRRHAGVVYMLIAATNWQLVQTPQGESNGSLQD